LDFLRDLAEEATGEFGSRLKGFLDWLQGWLEDPSEECLGRVLEHCREERIDALNVAVAELARYYGIASPEVITLEEAKAREMSAEEITALEVGIIEAAYDARRNFIVLTPKVLSKGTRYSLVKTLLHEFYHCLAFALFPADIKDMFLKIQKDLPVRAAEESFAEGRARGVMPLVEKVAWEKGIWLYD